MVILWMLIILTLLLIASLYKLKSKMNVLTILGCYLFSNILIELSGIIINLNLGLTESPNDALSLWPQKVASIGAKPILIIWAISFLFSDMNIYKKIMISLLILFSLVSFELLFIKVGFLEFSNWNTFYEFLRYVIIVIFTAIYVVVLQKFINKEMVA